jgi:hypothetical protein
MAEITRKRVGELQRGVFKILLNYADGLPAKELLEKLESVVPPTEFEKSEYPNRPGVRRFEKIVRFANLSSSGLRRNLGNIPDGSCQRWLNLHVPTPLACYQLRNFNSPGMTAPTFREAILSTAA